MTTLNQVSPIAGTSLYQSNQENESYKRRAQQTRKVEPSVKVSFSEIYRNAKNKGE